MVVSSHVPDTPIGHSFHLSLLRSGGSRGDRHLGLRRSSYLYLSVDKACVAIHYTISRNKTTMGKTYDVVLLNVQNKNLPE